MVSREHHRHTGCLHLRLRPDDHRPPNRPVHVGLRTSNSAIQSFCRHVFSSRRRRPFSHTSSRPGCSARYTCGRPGEAANLAWVTYYSGDRARSEREARVLHHLFDAIWRVSRRGAPVQRQRQGVPRDGQGKGRKGPSARRGTRSGASAKRFRYLHLGMDAADDPPDSYHAHLHPGSAVDRLGLDHDSIPTVLQPPEIQHGPRSSCHFSGAS